MTKTIYTAVDFTFFKTLVENPRTLKDELGYFTLFAVLTRSLCEAVKASDNHVISPAIDNNSIGGISTPIIIQGDFDRDTAISTFEQTRKTIVRTCRYWIEDNIQAEYSWRQAWNLWEKHAFSMLWVQADSINAVLEQLVSTKRSRCWIGINWQGESSSLSGINAIVWPGMARNIEPTESERVTEAEKIERFYKNLSRKLGKGFIREGEYLNIPELIQRLVTHEEIAEKLDLKLHPFRKIKKTIRDFDMASNQRWIGCFRGDGDRVGEYLGNLFAQKQNEAKKLTAFSRAMSQWATQLQASLPSSLGKFMYAIGDDFLGVFDRSHESLAPFECLEWLSNFNSEQESSIWKQHGQPITVSIGFVWAASSIPQQDVLQHCREALHSAKQQGRDRLALRVLFKNGNYLEWVCPWWFLQQALEGYRDRFGTSNWTHLYRDVAQLESRHAFEGGSEVALALFEIYFGRKNRLLIEKHLWDLDGRTGILGNRKEVCSDPDLALNHWIINLAKIGFHLCR